MFYHSFKKCCKKASYGLQILLAKFPAIWASLYSFWRQATIMTALCTVSKKHGQNKRFNKVDYLLNELLY